MLFSIQKNKIFFGIILTLIFSNSVFAEDEREIIGRVLNYKPLSEQEINIATIHRRFIENFFDKIRYDNSYIKKIKEGKYLVAEIFFVDKLKEGTLEGESYITKRRLRETKDFIIFLWQYDESSGYISPANFFSRAALRK